jgi:hypothetical protein
MEEHKVITFLMLFVLITLMLAIARQLSELNIVLQFPSSLNYIFPNLTKEGFEDLMASPGAAPEDSIKGRMDDTNGNPADPDLVDVRKPYSLLSDVLKTKQTAGTLTAKTCFDRDFKAHTERTGNFIQRTNNYQHAAPDNCSTAYTELVDSYYENP